MILPLLWQTWDLIRPLLVDLGNIDEVGGVSFVRVKAGFTTRYSYKRAQDTHIRYSSQGNL